MPKISEETPKPHERRPEPLTDAQMKAYSDLLRWASRDPDLASWGPYLIAANRDGLMIRVCVGDAPPDGYSIIGPNCAHTAAIWRAQDIQRGVDITQVQPPRY